MGSVFSFSCLLTVILLLLESSFSCFGAVHRDRMQNLHGTTQVPLLHQDFFQPSGVSLRDRVTHAVQASNARIAFLASVISKHGHFSTNSHDTGSAAAPNGTFVSPVYSGQGVYVMKITIGSPTKTFVVIADTGSDLIWVQCNPCENCFKQPDALFDPSKSSSFKKLGCSSPFCTALSSLPCSSTCKYEYEYGDQSSTSGDLATETITLSTTAGKKTAFGKVAFGCGHQNQGSFAKADGLVGLGRGPLSFTSQLGKYFRNKFSYCLVSFFDAPNKTSPLIFGDVVLPPSTKFQYTPFVTNNANPSFYYVGVTGISVNNVELDIPSGAFDFNSSGNGGLILDSGTTLCYLIPDAYNPLLKEVTDVMAKLKYPHASGSQIGLDYCLDLSDVLNPEFPDITFHFSGMDVTLPGANIFLEVDDQGTTCLAFASSDFGFSIFGNIQQQNFIVQYDLRKSRVGFAQAQCDTLG